VDAEAFVFVPGVVVGFNLAAHAVTEPGDGLLAQTPVYYPILRVPGNTGCALHTMELSPPGDGAPDCDGGQYAIDMQAFEAAIQPNTRIFVLCNPHNPVGRVFTKQELEGMAEVCQRHNLVICSDEIHCDLIFPGHRHLPIASLAPEIEARTITLMAPSKTYNIAGLHASVAIISNPELRRRFVAAQRGIVPHLDIMGYRAMLAAYQVRRGEDLPLPPLSPLPAVAPSRCSGVVKDIAVAPSGCSGVVKDFAADDDGDPWLEQVLRYLQANRDFVFDAIRRTPGLSMTRPEGTYLAWIDCRQAGIEEAPHRFFLEKARVGLNDGAQFGKGGEGFVRLNFACPRTTLAAALERMRAAL
jgi:cystathionine beta-lyase